MTHLTIGRAARAANVHVETIRFYERRGLIAQPSRPEGGGARRYDLATVERIRFVRQAQDIGFSLREIAELLSLRADPGADCADVRARAIEKREEVQVKLDRLARIRDALDELIARCPGGGDVKACTILEAVAAGDGFAEGSPAQRNSRDEAGADDMKTTVLAIAGMHCNGCARTIEALLARVQGVRRVEASFDERRARVLHDPDRAPVADLVTAIARGGFEAKEERP